MKNNYKAAVALLTAIMLSGCAERIDDTVSHTETAVTSSTFTNAIKQDNEVTTEFVFGVVAEQGAEESDLATVTTVPADLVPDLPLEMTTVATTVFNREEPIRFIDAAILRVTSDYSWLDKQDTGFVVCMDVTMDDIPDFVVVNTDSIQTVSNNDAYMAEAYSLKDMHSYGTYLENPYLSLWSEYVQPDNTHVKYGIFEYSTGTGVSEEHNRWEMGLFDTIEITEVGILSDNVWVHDGVSGTIEEYEAFTQSVYGTYEYVQPRDYIKGATVEALKEMSEEDRYISISNLFGDYAGKYEVPELSAIWE